MNAISTIRSAQTRGLYEIGLELAMVRHQVILLEASPECVGDGYDEAVRVQQALEQEARTAFQAMHGMSVAHFCELLS